MSRKTGDVLEKYVEDSIKYAGLALRKTSNSGAKHNDNDIMTRDFLFECKRQLSTKHAKLKADEWAKLATHAQNLGRLPIMVIEDSEGNKFAVMDFDQLMSQLAIDPEYDQ